MKATILLLFVSLLSLTSWSQTDEPAECSISQNGVYYSSMDSTTNIYIRFAGGDSVFTTSSNLDYDLAARYVVPSNIDHLLVGKYWVNNGRCMLKIKAKNEFGKVKMDGIISDDKLILTVINKDDNTSRDFVFEFYPQIN